MELTPIFRIEHFLDAIVNGTTNPYTPAHRIEYFLAKIAGEDVDIPDPAFRVEYYLAKLCGENVEIPTPVFRIEFWLAKKCGMDVETPTPAFRIEFWLDAWANGELPSDYKRVIGFKCANNAMWEITDFYLKGSDTVRLSFSVLAACNVFGCYQGTEATDNYDLYVSTSEGAKYFRYGNGVYASYWSADNLGNRFNVVFTPTGSSGMPEDSTWTAKTFTAANDMLIGSTTTTGTSSKMRGNFYGNIEVDGRLKLIPCERIADNVLGYYDTYSKTFYEPYPGFDGAESLGYEEGA